MIGHNDGHRGEAVFPAPLKTHGRKASSGGFILNALAINKKNHQTKAASQKSYYLQVLFHWYSSRVNCLAIFTLTFHFKKHKQIISDSKRIAKKIGY